MICSFCGAGRKDVEIILKGPKDVSICSDCIVNAGHQILIMRANKIPHEDLNELVEKEIDEIDCNGYLELIDDFYGYLTEIYLINWID